MGMSIKLILMLEDDLDRIRRFKRLLHAITLTPF
jgi:hypothetical protein